MAAHFHAGELQAQSLAGGGPRGAGIRPFLIEQHRAFFPLLPYLFAGVLDEAGAPIATVLAGEPGFVWSPDPLSLRIDALPAAADPAAPSIVPGRPIGLLGLDFATRRRNRANGTINARDGTGFAVAIAESFGNCPQYIQTRAVQQVPAAVERAEQLAALDDAAVAMIRGADTLFVATSGGALGRGAIGGADVSHRGGRPGFVRVEGSTLAIPDFPGNRYFNTLGNLLVDPRAGLLFIDFATGDVLQLQGTVEIDWQPGEAAPGGAERLWRFRVTRAWRRRAALPLRWAFGDYAPTTERTGVWAG